MRLELFSDDLAPAYREGGEPMLSAYAVRYQHLSEVAQRAVRVVGRGTYYSGDRQTYNLVYAPSVIELVGSVLNQLGVLIIAADPGYGDWERLQTFLTSVFDAAPRSCAQAEWHMALGGSWEKLLAILQAEAEPCRSDSQGLQAGFTEYWHPTCLPGLLVRKVIGPTQAVSQAANLVFVDD